MSTEVVAPHWEGAVAGYWRSAWRIPELYIFQRTRSTNDVISRAGRAGAGAGTTAIADHQSEGRGRLGRTWIAPPGSALLLSVLLRPGSGSQQAAAGALPLRVGMALARALRVSAGITCMLKWPNDVLAGGAKLAGVLCEASADFVVAGVGVNVLQQAADFPPQLDPPATSVRLAGGSHGSRARLAGAILDELRPLFTRPHTPLGAAELDAFAALDALAGCRITIDGELAGTAAGIDPRGALLVSGPDGTRTCHAGTVRRAP